MKIINAKMLCNALKNALANLEANKDKVNSLNVFPVPDGDTGTNMFLTMKSATKYGLDTKEEHCGAIAMAASKGALMGARGNSGVILSQILRGFGKGIESRESLDVKALQEGIQNAAEVSYKAVMKPTEGTILTVIRRMSEYATKHAREYTDVVDFLNGCLDEGIRTLNETPDMLPVLKQAGVVDAGGQGLLFLLQGAIDGVLGKEVEYHAEEVAKPNIGSLEQEESDIKFGYCTEFMIHTDYEDLDALKTKLTSMGDSLVCVKTDDIIKIHVHTNDPGLAIQHALSLGYLTDIKVDNMRFQHHNLLVAKEDLKPQHSHGDMPVSAVEKEFGFITVAAGQGIVDLFHDLQVDYVVIGGQTMNPSVEDLLEGIEKIQAKHIFILPNNSNIILTAENAAKLSEKDVTVIPTKTIPQGIATMLNFDENGSVKEIKENLLESYKHIKSGSVTTAVRDTTLDGKEIHKGDYMALLDGKIVESSTNRQDVLKETLKQALTEDSTMVTLFAGEEIDEATQDDDANLLQEAFPDVVIESIRGEQPVYYYLISIE